MVIDILFLNLSIRPFFSKITKILNKKIKNTNVNLVSMSLILSPKNYSNLYRIILVCLFKLISKKSRRLVKRSVSIFFEYLLQLHLIQVTMFRHGLVRMM